MRSLKERIDIIDGKIVFDTPEVQLYRRLRRESQHNPVVDRYWAEHNEKLKSQVGGEMKRGQGRPLKTDWIV